MAEAMQGLVKEKREFSFKQEDFSFLAKLLNEKTGIVLHKNKTELIYGRLARRLRALGHKSFKEYCTYLQGPKGDEELGLTVNAVTTNTTKFFREMHHFDYLKENVLKDAKARLVKEPGYRFRVWSAGCSSGEEPYCIAMKMRDMLGDHGRNCKILATDLDTNILAKGKEGVYGTDNCEERIPKTHLKKYMKKSKDKKSYEMSQVLKKMITFKQLNLLHDWPLKGPFDVIFCRNVMIYFDKDTQDWLVRRYAKLLKPGGILFVGHSESLLTVGDIFKNIGQTTYRKL